MVARRGWRSRWAMMGGLVPKMPVAVLRMAAAIVRSLASVSGAVREAMVAGGNRW